jgi:curved DNA-binding protein CbpA
MPENKHYYRTLQVDPAAEPEVITAAYKRLALKYHPDSNKSPDSLRRMQEINEAYEILSDPVKRESYNLQLSARRYSAQRQPVTNEKKPPSRPEGGANSPWESERRADRTTGSDESTEKTNRQLGYSFMVVYAVVTLILFRIMITRLTSIWMILLILILAGLITFPVVFKVDDFLRKQ